jgi:hypothetical protein
MIDLAQRSEPYEIALPYGLTVTVKPLTTAGMAAAQAAARRAVEAIERQARERAEAGLALDGLPDLSPESEREGFYQAQLIRELAVRHVTDWAGVELDGGPAPPRPENIAAVMELYPVGERFFQEFTLRQVLLNAAKNGCGPSAAGTSSRAEGPNTVGPAAKTGSPAREVSPDPTDGCVPTASTPYQPPGARGLGRAARLPRPATARAERARGRLGHERSAQARRRAWLQPRGALGAAAGGRGRYGRGFV